MYIVSVTNLTNYIVEKCIWCR